MTSGYETTSAGRCSADEPASVGLLTPIRTLIPTCRSSSTIVPMGGPVVLPPAEETRCELPASDVCLFDHQLPEGT
jgi:hypothetical protein